jgi:hypothetical protein
VSESGAHAGGVTGEAIDWPASLPYWPDLVPDYVPDDPAGCLELDGFWAQLTSAELVSLIRCSAPGADLALRLAMVDPGHLNECQLLEVAAAMDRQAGHDAAARNRVLSVLHRLPISAAGADPAAAAKEGPDALEDLLRSSRADALAARTGLSPFAGAKRIARALQLAPGGRLAAVGDLLGHGQILESTARLVFDRLELQTDEIASAVVDAVLAALPGMTWGRVDYRLRKEVDARQPMQSEQSHALARRDRKLTPPMPQPAGMSTIALYGPADDLAALWAAIDAIGSLSAKAERTALRDARKAAADGGAKSGLESGPGLQSGPGTGPSAGCGALPEALPLDAHRFDALMALGCAPLNGSGLPERHGRRPSIHVTMALTTLLDLDDAPADLAGYGPITAEVARRIAADDTGTWRRILTDPAGRLVDLSTARYRPPKNLADTIIARDRTCVFPNCARPAERCDLDHRTPWPLGETAECNLHALCRRHHRLKTLGLWRCRYNAERETPIGPIRTGTGSCAGPTRMTRRCPLHVPGLTT